MRVAAGQLYQANVCVRLEACFCGSALGLWCEAGARLRPPRAAFVASGDGAVASLSPEVFLARHGRHVRSEPIKGTRPLTDAGRADLAGATKDRAEHMMIVDLVRNDLGRVCTPGTVQVPRQAEVEALAGVWHLVSTVEGTLGEATSDAELVRAGFPPGSVTGAPKVAAETLCNRLEPTAREAYCGAMGFASADHGLELNAAHRARFRRSTGTDLAPALAAALASLGAGTWKIRVDEGDPGVTTTAGPVARPPVLDGGWSQADIALVTVADGLGAHKWADRAAVLALEQAVAPHVPVLCDEDGSVLEATWANAFAVIDGRLCTPSLDGRILPGVTRRCLLDEAVDLGVPLRIGRLGSDELIAADGVLLTSAVKGLVWVSAIAGARRFDKPHEIVALLAGALGRRWSA